MPYTDQEAVEGYIGAPLSDAAITQIESWIAAATNYIKNATGRVFLADEAASTRLFECGARRNALIIDDCVQITKVEVGDTYGDSFTEIAAPNYQTIPFNELPITSVGLKRQAWGLGIHRITAKWGYSITPPDDIKFAATVLVAGMATAYSNRDLQVKGETIGNYSVSYTDVKGSDDYERIPAILDGYRRITL